MKKLFFSLLVVFVCVMMVQADRENPRGLDRDAEMANRIAGMRATLAAEGHTFEIGMNPAMQYTLDQLCNFNPDLASADDFEHETVGEELNTVMALPASYTGYCGSVRNQGSCGSCWAFAITGAIEGQWAKQTGTYYNFSEQYLLDCNSYGYSCSGGFFSAFNDCKYPKYFKYESCYPYVAYKKTCTAPSSCNADYCTNWYYISGSSSVPTTSALKQKIYDYGAVAAAVYCDSYMQAYTSGCFTRNASGSCNHAITICGWNDNQCGTGVGAWKVKNSWGTSWGMSGFIWIKYGCQKIGYAACYALY
jgi:C1A family cysteine protease